MKKLSLFIFLLMMGCTYGYYEYIRDDSLASKITKNYKVYIKDNLKSYSLVVENFSQNKDIDIDWDKTSFILNGQTDGGFMFAGIKYIDRNNHKSPTIVIADSRTILEIFPNNLVYFSSGQYGGWRHSNIPDGKNGIYLVFKQGNTEYREKLLIERVSKYISN